jgi:hypothetical protein
LSLIRVQPDREWAIIEAQLRFSVAVDVPPDMVPIVVAPDLKRSIEILERRNGGRRLEQVPDRARFIGAPCCDQMMQPPGSIISLRFKPSLYQGDTDDAHNFDEISDPLKRTTEEGLIDWVAIVHIWEPTISVDLEKEKRDREALGPAQGFVTWDMLPKEAWSATRERFTNG